MLKKILFSLLISNICFASSALELETCCGETSPKLYLTADQIHLADQKIYISVDGITYEVPGLFSDENGYYIEKVAGSGDCAWYEWQCRNKKCKACNIRGIDWTCKWCGWPISDEKKHL